MLQKPSVIYPRLQQNLTPTSSGSTVCSYSHVGGVGGPIAILLHGYPQSTYMWRYLIPHLMPHVSLLVPELPGYGVSTLPSPGQNSKRAVGGAILEALRAVFNIGSTEGNPQKVVLIGHDRGARIAHRLTVDNAGSPHLQITSLILFDIVPIKVQWEAFSSPLAGTNYFHWPFLANVDLATKMIEAYGGDNWCREVLQRAQGPSPDGQASFAADGAHDIYAANFKKHDAVVGSCEDYRSGSMLEVEEQTEDANAGRNITIPTLVVFAEGKLGKMHDVAAVWKDWIEEGVEYQAVGIKHGKGHYLPEEDPEQIRKLCLDWIKNHTM